MRVADENLHLMMMRDGRIERSEIRRLITLITLITLIRRRLDLGLELGQRHLRRSTQWTRAVSVGETKSSTREPAEEGAKLDGKFPAGCN